MKKKNLILVAMATALLATSCAEEQQFGGAVSNSAIALHTTIGKVGTRATETTTANLHAFRAYSFLTDDNVNYMDGVTYSNSSGDWNTSAGSFYWPVKGELNFYCYAPETPGKTGTFAIDPSAQKLTDFAPFPTAATQQDLVYAKATGSLAANSTSGLDVNFSHALSEITIAAKNTNTAYTVEVSGVKLGNVISEGDFTFPSVAGADASWSIGDERSDYTTEWQNATTLSSTVSSLDASNTAFMLIPQQLAAQAKAVDGNYIALKVKITMQGGLVVHDGWTYVAIPTLWEMNKHYAYTLDFSEGAGQDENGNDIISGSEIKFNVTVTPWDEENIKLLRSYIRGVNSDNAALKLVINASGTADVTPMDNGSWEYDVTDKELTNLTNLFNNNGKITSLDLSHFDTQRATDMTAMFNGCSSLRSLDVSNFNTEKVTNMIDMFQNCSSLKTLNLSGWDLSSLSYYSTLLEGCNSLKSVNASGWTLPNPTNIQPFLIPTSLSSLEELICKNWKFKGGNSFNDLLNHCRINRADLSGWQTEKITNMGAMCYEATINHLNLSGWNTSNVTNMASAFNQSNIEDLNLTGWNTSNVTNMQYMFQNCQLLQSLDLSHFDMSKVKSTENMFSGCQSLMSLNLQGWSLLSESSLIMTFLNCQKLTSLNVTNWNAPKVTSIQAMFNGCSSLTSLDLSTWKMPSLETIIGMFQNCSKLKNINLSGWNTSKLTSLWGVFSGCSSLETIDLSGWNLDKLLNQGGVLQGCTNLRTIYMVGCNETTIEKIKQALTQAGLSTDIVKTTR